MTDKLREALSELVDRYADKTLTGVLVAADEQHPWIAKAMAALAESAPAPAQDGWRPIETALKDGERVLVADGDDGTYIARWTDDIWSEFGGRGGPSGWMPDSIRLEDNAAAQLRHPERWMPLPTPPQEPQG